MFLHPFFKGFFKNVVFSSVALVIKKLWAILDFFFTHRTFYLPVSYPMHNKNFYKKSFKFLFIKSQKKFTMIMSKMRVLGQKKTRGDGRQMPPPPACLGFKGTVEIISSDPLHLIN